MTQIQRTTLILCIAIVAILGLWVTLSPHLKAKPPQTKIATIMPTHQPMPTFSLVDTDNQTFTERSLVGKWTLLFFGYPQCPQVCPASLNIAKQAWQQFTPNLPAPVNFAFVTINPAPDSIASMRQFVQNFDNRFIGLTGKRDEILKLSNALGIYAAKTDDSTQTQPMIEHTSSFMLMNPKGRLHAIFTPPVDPNALVEDLKSLTKYR